jgi:hypothetical protein
MKGIFNYEISTLVEKNQSSEPVQAPAQPLY